MIDPRNAEGDRQREYGSDPGLPLPAHAGDSVGRSTRWWPLLLIALVAVVVVAVFLHPRAPLATPVPAPPSTPSVVYKTTTTIPTRGPSIPPLLTDPAPVSPGTTDVGRPVLGITAKWELFARARDSIVRIELANGRLTRTAVPALASSGAVSFLVGPDNAIIRPLDSVPGFAVNDGRNATDLPGALSLGGPIITGPDPGHLWADTAVNGGPDLMTLVDWQGHPTSTHFRLPAGWSAVTATSDGAGNFLLSAPNGDTYQASRDGRRLVTRGTLIATGRIGYLVDECDADGKCRTSLLARSTGARKVLASSTTTTQRPTTGGVISPDGKTAAVIDANNAGLPAVRLSLVDLDSGVERPLAAGTGTRITQGGMVWAPDSRSLFVATDTGRVAVIDRNTTKVSDLGLNLPFIEQLAIRAG